MIPWLVFASLLLLPEILASDAETRSVEKHRLLQVALADVGMAVMSLLIWYEFQIRKSIFTIVGFILLCILALNAMWTNFYSVSSEPTLVGHTSFIAVGICMHFSTAALFMGLFDLGRLCVRFLARIRRRCERKRQQQRQRVRTESETEDDEKKFGVGIGIADEAEVNISRSPTNRSKKTNTNKKTKRACRVGRWTFWIGVDEVKVAFGYVYVVILSLQGFYVAYGRPSVVGIELKYDAEVDGIPRQFDGYRIVEIADLHLGPSVGASRFAGVLDQVNELKPDILVIVGDLVDSGLDGLRGALEPLRSLRVPVYYVTGNHELYYNGVENWISLINELGVRTLVNDAVVIRAPGDKNSTLCLAGMDDLQGNRVGYPGHRANFSAALRRCPDEMPVILLVHQPRGAQIVVDTEDGSSDALAADCGVSEVSAAERRQRVKLAITGHTHAGQVAPFSFFGFLWSRLSGNFFNGLYTRKFALSPSSGSGSAIANGKLASTYVYVSAGTFYGCIPMRTGSVMEITVLTIRVA